MSMYLYQKGANLLGMTKASRAPSLLRTGLKWGVGAGLGATALGGAAALGHGVGGLQNEVSHLAHDLTDISKEADEYNPSYGPRNERKLFGRSDMDRVRQQTQRSLGWEDVEKALPYEVRHQADNFKDNVQDTFGRKQPSVLDMVEESRKKTFDLLDKYTQDANEALPYDVRHRKDNLIDGMGEQWDEAKDAMPYEVRHRGENLIDDAGEMWRNLTR